MANRVDRLSDRGRSGRGVVSGARLLPWCGEDGKPCFLLPGGPDSGFVARLADGLESVHLGMAVDLLDYVDVALPDRSVPELCGLVGPLRQSLRDVSRIARSRGERLGVAAEALELVIAARRLAARGEPSVERPAAELRGLVTLLREALSGVVDLAERYGDELPQPEDDEATLRAAEVINREISRRGRESKPAAVVQAGPAGDDTPAVPSNGWVTEGEA